MAEMDARKSPILDQLSVGVEKAVWQYMQQNIKYSNGLNKIIEDHGVKVDVPDNEDDHIVLSGADADGIERAQMELSALITNCQQVLKEEVVVFPDSGEVLTELDKFNTGAFAYRRDGKIYIIGTEEEVESCTGRMRELCRDERSDIDSKSESVPLQVEVDLWKYMEKNSSYADEIRRLKEDKGVEVVESADIPSFVRLDFNGFENDVEAARKAVSELVGKCRDNASTLRVPCSDSKIFAKVVKMLKIFSKLPGLVSAADNTIFVTGNEAEVAECLAKLEKLGVTCDASPVVSGSGDVKSVGSTKQGAAAATFDDPQNAGSAASGTAAAAAAAASDDGSSGTNTLKVEVDLWKYMEKNTNYASEVRRIKESMHVEVMESSADQQDTSTCMHLVFSGTDDDVAVAVKAASEAVKRCRDNASTLRVPCSDSKIFAKVVKMLKTFNKSPGLVSAADNTIFVTGNEAEVAEYLAKLEKLGVTCNASPVVSGSGDVKSVGSTKQGAAAATFDDPRGAGSAASGTATAAASDDGSSGTNTLKVEVDLWKYMEKNTNYASEVRRIKESMHVEVMESSADQQDTSTWTHLVFSGTDDDVAVAVKAASEAVKSCRQNTSTVRVPCRDNRVFSKISKVLKSVNKSQGFVSAADDTVSVTGSASEVEECLEKLKKLGLEMQSSTPTTTPPDNASGATGQSTRHDVERHEPAARHTASSNFSDFAGDFVGGGNETTIEIPVERRLWNFVEKRRQEKLQDLQSMLGLKLSAYPGQDSISMVLVEAETPDMADCGRDAFATLVAQLQPTIVIAGLETNMGGEIPRQMQSTVESLAENTDAIVEFSGSRILIIGPQDGVSDCQQRIVQSLQQMSGGNMGSMADPQSMQRSRHGGGTGFPGSSGFSRTGGGMAGSMGMMGGSSGAGMSHMGDDYGGGDPYMGAGGMGDDMSGYGGQSYDQYQSPGGPYDAGVGEQSDAGGPQMDDEDDDMDDDPEFYAMITGKKPADEAKLAQAASGTSKKSAAKAGAGRGGMTGASGNRGGMQNGGMTGPSRQSMPSGRGAPASGRTPTAGAGSFGAGSMPGGRGQAGGATPTGLSTDARRGRDDERETNAALRGKETEPEEIKRGLETCSTEACTVCQSGPHHFSVGKKCPHAFCTTCIQSYFSSGELECPVCGVKNDVIDHKFTQPPSGRLLITYDNKNKLPGFDASHGTIIVTYTFPAGIQTDDMTNPGRRFSSLTKTTFFPNTPDGTRIVELLEQAFEARLLFTVKTSTTAGADDELVWNGIYHKTAVFGGPRQNGFPDPVYLKRVQNELAARGFK